MHRNVPYEFSITLSCKDVVDKFLAAPVESI